jgi:hypothetical protein
MNTDTQFYRLFGNQFTLEMGSFLIISGLIRNILNAIIFYRNPTKFLMWLSFFASLIYILSSLFIRVSVIGFHSKWFSSVFVWCQIRVHIGQLIWFISVSCMCYAMIDRYIVSSKRHLQE